MSDGKIVDGPQAPGDFAADFALKDAYEKERKLSDFRGKWVVLYFYPKDDTPGCTMEAMEFSELKEEFEANDGAILGVSKDSCESHQRFIDKKALTISLLSDPDASVQKIYGVWKPKKFMGKEFMGTQRTTFLIGPDGKIAKRWDGVNPIGHAKEVLGEIKSRNRKG